jgi:hypothetical protein
VQRAPIVATVVLLGATAVAGLVATGFAAEFPEARVPVLATPRFHVFDDFETNLNDSLIAAGVARRFGKPELFAAGEEVACFGTLAPSARAGWQKAVDWYVEFVSPKEFDTRPQYQLRLALAGLDRDFDEAELDIVAIARGLREAASPAYRRCRWPAQEEKNGRFIAALASELERYEAIVAPRLERIYRKSWSGGPIHVDVVETVSWAGADSVFPDGVGGHLLISSETPPGAALELIFHEASHGLMLRGDPLRQAIVRAAEDAEADTRDLWHPVLFFTTGEIVRRALEEGGRPGYTPMIEEIYRRSPWGAWREAIALEWAPYVRGERELDEAARALVAAVAPTPKSE